MLELHIANPDVTGGTIQVSWCVDIKELKYLSELGVSDPMVVLVVAPDGPNYHIKKEHRVVVPMKDLVAYLEFSCPGKNKIWGFISRKNKKLCRNDYLGKIGDRYHTDILDYCGESWGYLLSTHNEVPLSVDVPAECFAPDPPEWEKKWTNHFFSDKCVDQCHYRRRRIFSYLAQPVLMLFNLLARFVLLLTASLLATRGWDAKYLLHPMTYSLMDSLEVLTGGTALIRRLPEDSERANDGAMTVKYIWRKLCFVPFIPAVLLLMSLLILTHHAIVIAFVLGIAVIVLGLFILLAAFLDGTLFSKLWERISASSDKAPWYMDQEEMNLIVCTGDKKPLTLETLPVKHQTLRLKFQDLKSKVCKPFSR